MVAWRKRVWRCPDTGCPVGVFSETHPLIEPRAKLTTRAVRWATDALAHDYGSVTAAVSQSVPSSGWLNPRLARHARY